MKKNTLMEFIKKYSLNNIIEKCRWVSNEKDKTLTVSVVTETKNLLVDLQLSNWDGFGDAEVGIGETSKFKRELGGVYGEDITFVLNYNDDKSRIISIDVLDGDQVGTLTTADLDIIPKSSKLKQLPEINAEIIFDIEFKDRFLKAKAALPDVESFTVMMNKKNELQLVVGYSNINSSRFSLKPKTTDGKNTVAEMMHFNANYLKEIINANSECDSFILKISNKGLAFSEFVSGDFVGKYYLTSLDD